MSAENYTIKISNDGIFPLHWKGRIYRPGHKIGVESVYAWTEKGARKKAERAVRRDILIRESTSKYEYEVKV